MMPARDEQSDRDPLLAVLKWGLAVLIATSPLAFGAVTAGGRAYLEIGSFVLLGVWLIRASFRATPVPRRAVLVGVFGLLVLGLLQAVPLGSGPVGLVSPHATTLRENSMPDEPLRRVEERLLGVDDLSTLDPAPSISLDPERTASALRTGAALVAALLVATTVAASGGAISLVAALCLAAAFQALYGTLMLVSGHEAIWNIPKVHYLGSATGTFVNRNHFADFVAMGAACGLGLAFHGLRQVHREPDRSMAVVWLGTRGARVLIVFGLVTLSVIGLLLSFSRAGIAIGLFALGWVALRSRRGPLRRRAVIVFLVVGLAAIPLLQVGAERLGDRYGAALSDFTSEGGRGRVWADTAAMVAAFPAVGSGFGTFGDVYPTYRSGEVRRFFRHAHNDLLQFIAEGGILALGLLGCVLVPLARSTVTAMSGDRGILATGIAAALAVILGHALIDFPFHIPANAAAAAMLAGALEGLSWRAKA